MAQGPILLVVGARPNFMKIAPLLRSLINRDVPTLLLHTGQHYDENMSGVFFEDLNMRPPDIHLDVGSASHAVQTATIMIRFEEVCREHSPSMVVVVGDVNSTIACALVAKKMQIPVAHVEAGLRSGDRTMPEEINRILTDSISDLLFTPSRDGDENLIAEGVDREIIHFVGNIMIDSLFDAIPRSAGAAAAMVAPRPPQSGLLTLHRPSNVDDPDQLSNIISCILDMTRDTHLVFPVHPRTRSKLTQIGLMDALEAAPWVCLTEPMGYLAFVDLMQASAFVLTDSGGLQEETTALGIPCLTIRENTERPITITEGTNRLVGTDPAAIERAFSELSLNSKDDPPRPEFWDGGTADRIAEIILASLDGM